jgi:hypothetical protein
VTGVQMHVRFRHREHQEWSRVGMQQWLCFKPRRTRGRIDRLRVWAHSRRS